MWCSCLAATCGAATVTPEELPAVPREDVTGYLRRQEGWVDAVAVTGGEPTLHGEELDGLLADLQDCGCETILETNGTRPGELDRLMKRGLMDALSMDFKAPLTTKDYRRVTQRKVDVDKVHASIELIINSGLEHEFRITVVPGLVGHDELERMVPLLEGAGKVALQNFKPDLTLDPELREVKPHMPGAMDEFRELFEGVAHRCVLRGRQRGLSFAGERGETA